VRPCGGTLWVATELVATHSPTTTTKCVHTRLHSPQPAMLPLPPRARCSGSNYCPPQCTNWRTNQCTNGYIHQQLHQRILHYGCMRQPLHQPPHQQLHQPLGEAMAAAAVGPGGNRGRSPIVPLGGKYMYCDIVICLSSPNGVLWSPERPITPRRLRKGDAP